MLTAFENQSYLLVLQVVLIIVLWHQRQFAEVFAKRQQLGEESIKYATAIKASMQNYF